ncbi:hypothetical protein AVEN_172040-1 [Araneus ventricosus]|uniref:Uncharacterized protein n=1 Tax=Araneus ventricosus TaxID=182803 RepID=A0A4Y2SAE9_ARAVE|nr:hypothetical protein AVEN_153505-1 [Araneus ventricosus]GBN84235.1 hypothetical protein AVEN_172040-1 [Araneus ventricosus]
MSGITFDKAKFSVGLGDNVVNMLGKIESSVKSNTKQHVGYSRTDLVILNRGKKARTTPKPAPSCPRFCQTSGRTFGPDGFSVHQARLYGGSSMEQGLELGALRYRSRYFTTRSSRFPQIAKKVAERLPFHFP